MAQVSLSRFLADEQFAGRVDAQLRLLLESVARAAVTIGAQVGRGALAGVLGEAGSQNVQGEAQKKLDVIANDIFLQTCEASGAVAAMASEEMETVHPVAPAYAHGDYLLLFDPLDGSSNIDVNVSVGTIFSVLKYSGGQTPQEADFLQAGRAQCAAGYAIYGPSTMLVLSVGHGVQGFTLARDTGEFVLTHPDITVPPTTREFAINASNERFWEAPVQRYVRDLRAGKTGARGVDFNMRWVASMVADVHRILSRGGVFLYPMDEKCRAQGGKLRLLYEANPMSMLIEQAGGAASTGREPILDIAPQRLHQRVPVVLGSRDEVHTVVRYHEEAN